MEIPSLTVILLIILLLLTRCPSAHHSQLRSTSREQAAEDDDDDVDWGEDVSEAAVQARRIQELSGAVSSMVVTEDLEKTPSERVDIFYAYVKVSLKERRALWTGKML